MQQWYKLVSEGGAKLGSVRLKLTYRRDTILPLADYAALRVALEGEDMTAQTAVAKICVRLVWEWRL